MRLFLAIATAVVGMAAAALVGTVFWAYGNAFIPWAGWNVLAPLLGAAVGVVLVLWVADRLIGTTGPGWRARLAHWRVDPTDPWNHDQEACDLCQRRTR